MFCEEIKIPGLPGEGTVTDGSVDWYEMDWENVDNGVTEEQMPRNVDKPCTAQDPCTDNSPVAGSISFSTEAETDSLLVCSLDSVLLSEAVLLEDEVLSALLSELL